MRTALLPITGKGGYFGLFFDKGDALCKGRLSMISHSVIAAVITQLTTGIFYTGFLLGYGIDIVNVGIIAFIPYVAGMFSFVSPYILRHFRTRKAVGVGFKLAYYTLSILGITCLPSLVSSPPLRIVGICLLLFVSNICNFISEAALMEWHLNYIPVETRASYFTVDAFLQSLIPGIMLLVSSLITDSIDDEALKLQVIVVLRLCAYAAAIAEIIVIVLPKEKPAYGESSPVHLKEIFSVPLAHKGFRKSMIVTFWWTFFTLGYCSAWFVYLLETVRMSYTYFNVVIAVYSVFFIFFGNFWVRKMKKYSWYKVFSWGLIPAGIMQIFLAATNAENYFFLFMIARLIQHFFGIAHNVAFTNIAFANMPEEGKSPYIACKTIVTNLGTFVGVLLSTLFVAALGESKLLSLSAPQLLIAISGIGYLLVAIYCLREAKSGVWSAKGDIES